MKKLLLLSALVLGLSLPAALAADASATPVVINDTTKVAASGNTVGTLAGQVTLQANNTSVVYNLTTGQFTDASGKPVTLANDQRRVLVASAKQALAQAAKQSQTGSYGDNSPAVLASLVKTLIALDPAGAAGYTNVALAGLLGPKTGLTDKGNAIALITGTATNAISESSLSPAAKSASLASVDKLSALVRAKVSDPATDIAPVDTVITDAKEIITPVDPTTISNGSGNGN
ncbi:MAG: hypothetical protein JSS11_00400 [Verrucomicrobia bacterium]|nr:hypothetical protein [Verrucomicrobiota bacterium]